MNLVKWYINEVRRKNIKHLKENKRHGRITEKVSNSIQKDKRSAFLQSCWKQQNSDYESQSILIKIENLSHNYIGHSKQKNNVYK